MSEKSLRERLRRSFKWNKSTHQTDQEDTPWIEETVLQLPGNENDRQGCLLDLFLDTLDRSPRLGYELPVFSRILNPAIFDQILSKGYDGSDKLAAWLHDQGAAGETREYNGPVSIATLDHILTLKRINEPRMKNAETRRIYIPNPSPTAIGILILRATKSLAPAFKSSIFHYLDMSTRIGLRLAVSPDEFTLEFHMPSFAWRSDAVFLQDTRSTVDHHPIRQSTELSFLSRTPQPIVSMDYLHEFQTSICLTGRSTSSWTAVCLVDSYFEETADPGNDYLMSEFDEADEGGHKSRNLAQRNVNSNRLSRLDPREYFLRIVKRRISRTKEEWINTSYKIQSSIHSGVSGIISMFSLAFHNEVHSIIGPFFRHQ
ncbi:hypothetical protein K456DRAFT_1852472 [Colletotrichum gloeosporioides 23]|nr:hypothetical protein K456DRAFT_1852472 [Colletotrichum gloeosporioides 23]